MSLTVIKEKINNFDSFLNKLNDLSYLEELNFDEDKTNLNSLKDQINSHRFEIAVIGEFSTGKSTFINALLKEDLLPMV